MTAFFHGLILAFGLILPLGVQNLFIFNQGVNQPKLRLALPAVVTAAICDTLLIIVSVAGLSVIVWQLETLRIVLIVAGILFLTYMGVVIWRTPAPTQEEKPKLTAKQQVMFALSVSLLNPHALLDTLGVIGTSGMNYSGIDLMYFAFACIAVSWVWFFGLAIVGATVKRARIQDLYFSWLNKCSAIFIWITALLLLQTVWKSIM